MSAVRIKKGDTVKVIAGKDKGKTGKVMSVNAKNHTALVAVSYTHLVVFTKEGGPHRWQTYLFTILKARKLAQSN